MKWILANLDSNHEIHIHQLECEWYNNHTLDKTCKLRGLSIFVCDLKEDQLCIKATSLRTWKSASWLQ
jgi:hypothetical protein